MIRIKNGVFPDEPWSHDCVASHNDQYRYWLSRRVAPESDLMQLPLERVIFAMLNPSTARGDGQGDPTQRKCDGFAKRLGARSYGLVNLFAASTPYPTDLFTFGYEAALGEYNDEALRLVLCEAKLRGWPLICAWGNPSLPKSEKALFDHRVRSFVDLCRSIDLPTHALLVENDYPRHPLMLGYKHATLKPWSPEL